MYFFWASPGTFDPVANKFALGFFGDGPIWPSVSILLVFRLLFNISAYASASGDYFI